MISHSSSSVLSLSLSSITENYNTDHNVTFSPWSYLFGVLACACALMTVMGNFLVVFAVIKERYLRSMTNYFIVSLAVSDLLVGSVVMPFAIIEQLMNEKWIFGEWWCDLWHAFDVLSATASILNLCMIAVERYWAIQHPMTYASRMNKRHCVLMLLVVWISSAVISFPAILWWRSARNKQSLMNRSDLFNDSQHINMTATTNSQVCEFTVDSLYLISSSIVSFYGPFIVMVLVYYRIYRTATNLLKSLNAGSKVVFKNGQRGEKVVLRIHRGGGSNSGLMYHDQDRPRSSFSMPSRNGFTRSCMDLSEPQHYQKTTSKRACAEHDDRNNFLLPPKDCRFLKRNSESSNYLNIFTRENPTAIRRFSQQSMLSTMNHRPSKDDRKRSSCFSSMLDFDQNGCTFEDYENLSISQRIAAKLRKFAMRKRLTKVGREQKAAKTLGIVMGVFIFCWLPFFTCNVIQAIHPELMQSSAAKLIYKAVTWLGYINSSINPLIYAHSMRDFRRAFIKLMCGWYLRRLYSIQGNNLFLDECNSVNATNYYSTNHYVQGYSNIATNDAAFRRKSSVMSLNALFGCNNNSTAKIPPSTYSLGRNMHSGIELTISPCHTNATATHYLSSQ